MSKMAKSPRGATKRAVRGNAKAAPGRTSVGQTSNPSLLLLAALRRQDLHGLIGAKVPLELWNGDLRLLRQALDLYWKRAKRSQAEADPRGVRLLVKRLAGKSWERVEGLVAELEKIAIPKDRVIYDVLEDWIQRQSLYMMAQEILSEYDKPGSDGKLETTRYRDRLDALSGLTFEAEEEHQIDYVTAPTDYYTEIMRGRVPTGIEAIDRSIRGGIGPGEFGLVIAPPKRGKTTILVNFGANAALAGKRVLHISLEIHSLVALERYDMRLSGYTSDRLQQDTRLMSKGRNAVKKAKGGIIIQDLSHEVVTVSRVESLIRRYSPLDLVILDYPGLMFGNATERRFEIGNVTRDLRRLAHRMYVPMWGAAQGNRSTIDAEEYGMSGIAEDISQMFTCDLAVCAMQTDEEKSKGLMRLHVEATRGAAFNPTAFVRMGFDTMTMSPVREEV